MDKCPECGSPHVTMVGNEYECEYCGHAWVIDGNKNCTCNTCTL